MPRAKYYLVNGTRLMTPMEVFNEASDRAGLTAAERAEALAEATPEQNFAMALDYLGYSAEPITDLQISARFKYHMERDMDALTSQRKQEANARIQDVLRVKSKRLGYISMPTEDEMESAHAL